MDKTIPLGGGWVMITRRLPTPVQVPVLSIFYAVPDKAFEAGYFEHGGPLTSDPMADLVYRSRQGAKLDPWDVEKVRAYEMRRENWDRGELEIELRVKIQTPAGTVCVNPYEYSVVGSIDAYLGLIGDGVTMHELSGMKRAGKLREQLFFCRARGVPKVEAYRMLLGSVDRPGVFWLEIDSVYAQHFGIAA